MRHPPTHSPHMLCIGAGTMALALLLPPLRHGVFAGSGLTIAEQDTAKHTEFENAGARCHSSIARAMEGLPDNTMLMLATKPQHLADVSHAFSEKLGRDFLSVPRTCVSILAGSTRDLIARQFRKTVGHADIRVVRVMPNLPASVEKGIAAMCASTTVDASHVEFTRSILRTTSETIDLDEALFDAFTAVAGSGPAYLFYLVEAMEQGAMSVGFDSVTAREVVRATVVGSAALLHKSPQSAAVLRAAVTSKGGTTQAATDALDRRDVMQAFAEAIERARDRAVVLGTQE